MAACTCQIPEPVHRKSMSGIQQGTNVLGEPLEVCSVDPLTGFYRDGCCRTGGEDLGMHTVCAVMTEEFLDFSVRAGNDLSTPRPEFGFPGLEPGDRVIVTAIQRLRAGLPVEPEEEQP